MKSIIVHSEMINNRQYRVSGLYRRPNYIGTAEAIEEDFKRLTDLKNVEIRVESKEQHDTPHGNVAAALAAVRMLCKLVNTKHFELYASGFSAHYVPPNATLFTTEMDFYNRLRIETKAGIRPNVDFKHDVIRVTREGKHIAIVGAFPTSAPEYDAEIPQLFVCGKLVYETDIVGEVKTDVRPFPKTFGEYRRVNGRLVPEWFKVEAYNAPGTYYVMNWKWYNTMEYILDNEFIRLEKSHFENIKYAGKLDVEAWNNYVRMRYPTRWRDMEVESDEAEQMIEESSSDSSGSVYNPYYFSGVPGYESAGLNVFNRYAEHSYKSMYTADALDHLLCAGMFGVGAIVTGCLGWQLTNWFLAGMSIGRVICSVGSFAAANGYDVRSWYEGKTLNDIPENYKFIPCMYVNLDKDACSVPVTWTLFSGYKDFFTEFCGKEMVDQYQQTLVQLIAKKETVPVEARSTNYSIAVLKGTLISLSQRMLLKWCEYHPHYKYGQNGFKIVNSLKPEPGLGVVLDGDSIFTAGHVSMIHVLGTEYNADEQLAQAKMFDEVLAQSMEDLSICNGEMAIERKVYDFHDVFLYRSDNGDDTKYFKYLFNFCNASFDRATVETIKQRVGDDDARLSVTVAAMQQLKEGYNEAVKNVGALKKYVLDHSEDAKKTLQEQFVDVEKGVLNWKAWASLTSVAVVSLLIPSVRRGVISSVKWMKEMMVAATSGFTLRSILPTTQVALDVDKVDISAENQPATVPSVDPGRMPFIPVNSVVSQCNPSSDQGTNDAVSRDQEQEKKSEEVKKEEVVVEKEEPDVGPPPIPPLYLPNAQTNPAAGIALASVHPTILSNPNPPVVKQRLIARNSQKESAPNGTIHLLRPSEYGLETGGHVNWESEKKVDGVMTTTTASMQSVVRKDEEKLGRKGEENVTGVIEMVCTGQLDLKQLLQEKKLSTSQRNHIYRRVRQNNGISSEALREKLIKEIALYKISIGVSSTDPDVKAWYAISPEKHRMRSDVAAQRVSMQPSMNEHSSKGESATNNSSEESSGVGETTSLSKEAVSQIVKEEVTFEMDKERQVLTGLLQRLETEVQDLKKSFVNLQESQSTITSGVQRERELYVNSNSQLWTRLEQISKDISALSSKNLCLSSDVESMKRTVSATDRNKQEPYTPLKPQEISELLAACPDLKITSIQDLQLLRDVIQGKSPCSTITVTNQDGTSAPQMSRVSIDVSQDILGEKRLEALLSCLDVKKNKDSSTMLKEDLRTVVSEMKAQYTQVKGELDSLRQLFLQRFKTISSNMEELFDISTAETTTSSSTKGKKTEMKSSGRSKGSAWTAELKENPVIQSQSSSSNTTTSGVGKMDLVQSMTQLGASVKQAAENTIRTAGLGPDTTIKSSLNNTDATNIFQSLGDFFKNLLPTSTPNGMENDQLNMKESLKENCWMKTILLTMSSIWTFVTGSAGNMASRFKNNCVLNLAIDTIAYKFGIYPGLIYAVLNSFPQILPTQSAYCLAASVPHVMSGKNKKKVNRNRIKNASRKAMANAAKFRSVKAAIPQLVNSVRMPAESRDWLKSVLDPAHATSYAPKGIPDDNTKTTVVRTVHKTYSPSIVPAKGENIYFYDGSKQTTIKNDAANVSWSINRVFFVLTECMSIDYIQVIEYNVTITSGTSPPQGGYVGYGLKVFHNDGTAKFVNADTGDGSGRLMSRGFTIEPIGMKMYRGGYFSAYTPNQSTFYEDNTNNSYLCLPAATIDDNPSETFGDEGVYATLIPYNIENMCQFRKTDNSDSIMLMDANGVYNKLSCGWTDNLMHLPGWKQSWVAYYPPASITSTNQTEFTSGMISLRVTCFSTVEVLKSKANGGQNAITKDNASLESVVALGEFIDGYYPASYNDLKKVIGNIRKFYNEHKDIIDVAAGFIPYGGTVNSVLNSLLNSNATTTARNRKQLVRTR